MVSSDKGVMKLICPALAVLATLVALFGPWFTRTTVTGRTVSSTLLEVIRGESFVEYTSQQWLWISGAGVLLVIASVVAGKKIAQAGAVLMLMLPGWSLFNVYVNNEGFDAGWAMWVAAVLVVAAIVVSRMLPEDEEPQFVTPQVDRPAEQ